MDAGIEKECSALGGLFQLIMNDMKSLKLQGTTIVVTGAFLDAFQKVADMATGTRGATKDIGSALTRMCMRHRSIESKLKLFTTALSEGLITPLELKMEEWKKAASQLDKDHAKEYKKARSDIKKKSSDTIKLQKKVKKGKDEARGQLDCALQDVNVRYAVLEETEKRAVCKALIEERARYCSFVSMLKPVLDHEINMLGEVTHLQTILEDLTNLTAEPNKLPPASEQVILDLKGSDFNYTYQTPPASPGNRSRRSSISSRLRSPLSLPLQSCSARDQLVLTLGALNSDAPRSSRDSLHCSSGYSTQTTTPSCSEDTIHTHSEYRGLSHGDSQSDFDKSSTMPRNSDLRFQYREFAQSRRPTSTVSLLAEGELSSGSGRLSSHTATIRRKPSPSVPYRRGTISGGIPIPISTPQVPPKGAGGGGSSNDDNVFKVPPAGGLQSQLQLLNIQQQQLVQQQLQQQLHGQQQRLEPPKQPHLQPQRDQIGPRAADQHQDRPAGPDQNPEPPAQQGEADMLTLIRKVTLKRTVTNDRSAPLLPPPPPPVNHN
uniref:MTSS I-BAR domain containing 1 n=1 Tax=Fundulus heteroclitus TaxID=8078 RepID=A0A3Q2SSK5_FUNHE